MKRAFTHPLCAIFLVCVWAPAGAQSPTNPTEALRDRLRALENLPVLIPSEQVHGRIGVFGIGKRGNEIVIDLGKVVVPDEVVIFPARIPTEDSGGFPRGLEVEIAEAGTFTQTVRLGRWSEDSPGKGDRLPFLRIAGNGAAGRFLRIRVSSEESGDAKIQRFATLGEIVVLEKGANAALLKPVTIGTSIENPPRWQISNLTDGYLWCLPLHGRETAKSNGYHSRIETTEAVLPKWVEVDLGEDRVIDELHLVAAHPRDYADTAGFGFPPRFRISGKSEDGIETVLFDSGEGPFSNPGAAPAMIPGRGVECRLIRIETADLWRRTNDYIFALAELQVWSRGENVALGKVVTTSDSTLTGRWKPAALVDGCSSRHELLSWPDWLDLISRRESLQAEADVLAAALERDREIAMRRGITGATVACLLIALGATALVLSQRRRSARESEALKVRLANDLHDELGASLSHLALQSDLARRRVALDDPVADRLISLSESARETLDHLRDMVWLLSPAAGTWEDLETRLAGIAARLLDGVSHEFSVEGKAPDRNAPIDAAREIVLFLKEALTNARKHASADHIEVKMRWQADTLRLEIIDDGTGFDSSTPRPSAGRGLCNLETRAKTLHGTFDIRTIPGEGTQVLLEVPTRDP